ncbi:ProQ/FINO family protein, partial [Neisseria sp. P0015.S010]
KRFDLNNRFKGEVSAEEQTIAQQHPAVQQALAAQAERQAAKATTEAEAAPAQAEINEAAE